MLSFRIEKLAFLLLNVLFCVLSDRTEESWNRPVSRNEHNVSLLVILPTAALQQEDVPRVSQSGSGGCQGRTQVTPAAVTVVVLDV